MMSQELKEILEALEAKDKENGVHETNERKRQFYCNLFGVQFQGKKKCGDVPELSEQVNDMEVDEENILETSSPSDAKSEEMISEVDETFQTICFLINSRSLDLDKLEQLGESDSTSCNKFFSNNPLDMDSVVYLCSSLKDNHQTLSKQVFQNVLRNVISSSLKNKVPLAVGASIMELMTQDKDIVIDGVIVPFLFKEPVSDPDFLQTLIGAISLDHPRGADLVKTFFRVNDVGSCRDLTHSDNLALGETLIQLRGAVTDCESLEAVARCLALSSEHPESQKLSRFSKLILALLKKLPNDVNSETVLQDLGRAVDKGIPKGFMKKAAENELSKFK